MLPHFAKSTWMMSVLNCVQNLCRNWDVSVPVHYSLEGLRFGQQRQYIPSAASNFMFSKSSRLNTSASEIAEHFGASGSTIAQKSRVIKDLLKISNVFDPDFSLKEIADNNPFNHLVMRNGFIFFDTKKM